MRIHLHNAGLWVTGLAVATWLGVHAVRNQAPTHHWYDWALYMAIGAGALVALFTAEFLRGYSWLPRLSHNTVVRRARKRVKKGAMILKAGHIPNTSKRKMIRWQRRTRRLLRRFDRSWEDQLVGHSISGISATDWPLLSREFGRQLHRVALLLGDATLEIRSGLEADGIVHPPARGHCLTCGREFEGRTQEIIQAAFTEHHAAMHPGLGSAFSTDERGEPE